MFFFKRKQIVVDAFAYNETMCEALPIKPASSFLPEWWRAVPNKFIDKDQNGLEFPRPTIKRCDGLLEYFKNSFIIPLWSDVIINTHEDGRYAWRWSEPEQVGPMMSHDRREYGPTFDNYIHTKIISPWLLKEKTGVKFHWGQPIWNDITAVQKYITVPAVIDYKYQLGTHINIFMPRKEAIINISAGTPMVHLTPLTDQEVVIKCHTITPEEHMIMRNVTSYNFAFTGKFKKRKQALIANQSKCPFGFGK